MCAEFGIRAESVRSGVRSPAQHDETWLDFIVTFVIVVVVYLIYWQSSTTKKQYIFFTYVSEMVTLLNLCHLYTTIVIF